MKNKKKKGEIIIKENKRWKWDKNKKNKRTKKNERRGPESKQKMMYFKILLCGNFVRKIKD